MKVLYIILGSLPFLTACDNDLEQFPPNIASSNSLNRLWAGFECSIFLSTWICYANGSDGRLQS